MRGRCRCWLLLWLLVFQPFVKFVGQWQQVFSGKKIGYKRIIFAGRASARDLKLPPCDAVRLRIDNALACPLINNFQIITQ